MRIKITGERADPPTRLDLRIAFFPFFLRAGRRWFRHALGNLLPSLHTKQFAESTATPSGNAARPHFVDDRSSIDANWDWNRAKSDTALRSQPSTKHLKHSSSLLTSPAFVGPCARHR